MGSGTADILKKIVKSWLVRISNLAKNHAKIIIHLGPAQIV
jgi:hypothetical protein